MNFNLIKALIFASAIGAASAGCSTVSVVGQMSVPEQPLISTTVLKATEFPNVPCHDAPDVGKLRAAAAAWCDIKFLTAQTAEHDVSSTTVQSYVQGVGDEMLAAAGLAPGSVEFVAFVDDNINAKVTSAGAVLISHGLIEQATSEDQIAFFVAHELGHRLSGDVTDKALSHKFQLGARLLAQVSSLALQFQVEAKALAESSDQAAAARAEDRKKTSDALFVISELMDVAISPRHGRRQEIEADFLAIDLLQRAGYNVPAVCQMLQNMADDSYNQNFLKKLGSRVNVGDVVGAGFTDVMGKIRGDTTNKSFLVDTIRRESLSALYQELQEWKNSYVNNLYRTGADRAALCTEYYITHYSKSTAPAERSGSLKRVQNSSSVRREFAALNTAIEAKSLIDPFRLEAALVANEMSDIDNVYNPKAAYRKAQEALRSAPQSTFVQEYAFKTSLGLDRFGEDASSVQLSRSVRLQTYLQSGAAPFRSYSSVINAYQTAGQSDAAARIVSYAERKYGKESYYMAPERMRVAAVNADRAAYDAAVAECKRQLSTIILNSCAEVHQQVAAGRINKKFKGPKTDPFGGQGGGLKGLNPFAKDKSKA